MVTKKELTPEKLNNLLQILSSRFAKNTNRHMGLSWTSIQTKLVTFPEKLWSLANMEDTGGEPDVIGYNKSTSMYLFCDCSPESPTGRRSLCFDRDAWESRKEAKPKGSALEMAQAMGIELLSEDEYRQLQKLGVFDTKTSSWIQTPEVIRKLGGALFCDRRYNTVFTYHNGAESYYAARGFRGIFRV